jgi:hypothetical protein
MCRRRRRPLQDPLRHVVAVEPAILPGVGRRQRPAVHPKDQPLQQRRRLRPVLVGAHSRADLQHGMRPVPQLPRHDALVLAGIDLPLVRGLADIGPVVQQLVDVALVQRPARLAGGALRPEAGHRLDARSRLGEDLEHAAHPRGLILVHHQLPGHDVVAERHLAPHPHAAGAGGGEFVADSLANDLALELGESSAGCSASAAPCWSWC